MTVLQMHVSGPTVVVGGAIHWHADPAHPHRVRGDRRETAQTIPYVK